jgi:hypothetical protein
MKDITQHLPMCGFWPGQTSSVMIMIFAKSVETLRITFAAPMTTTSIMTYLIISVGIRQGALVIFHAIIPRSVNYLRIV